MKKKFNFNFDDHEESSYITASSYSPTTFYEELEEKEEFDDSEDEDLYDELYDEDDTEDIKIIESDSGRLFETYKEFKDAVMDAIGEGDFNQAYYYIYQQTKNFVKSEISKQLRASTLLESRLQQSGKNEEDLEQDIWTSLYEKLNLYDPDKAKITTWEKIYIKKHISEAYMGSLSTNYGRVLARLNKIKKQWEDEGRGEPSYLDYHIESQISMTTIKKAFALSSQANATSLEAIPVEVGNITDASWSPEKSFVKKNTAEAIYKAITNLPEPHKSVFCLLNAENLTDMRSYFEENFHIDILSITQVKENVKRDLIAKLTGIAPEKVQEYNKEAIFMLQNNNEFLNKIGKKGNKSYDKREREAAIIPMQFALDTLSSLEEIEYSQGNMNGSEYMMKKEELERIEAEYLKEKFEEEERVAAEKEKERALKEVLKKEIEAELKEKIKKDLIGELKAESSEIVKSTSDVEQIKNSFIGIIKELKGPELMEINKLIQEEMFKRMS